MIYHPDFTRFKKLTLLLRNLMYALFWATVCFGALAAVATLVISFLPSASFVPGSNSGTLGFTVNDVLSIKVDPSLLVGVSLKPILLSILVMVAIACAATARFAKQLAALLHSVVQDRPFDPENANRLSVMGRIVIAGAIAYQVAMMVSMRVIANLLNSPQYVVNNHVDFDLIMVGGLLLVLSGIFRYGSFLQRSYDETV